jgi:hypothetical protein
MAKTRVRIDLNDARNGVSMVLLDEASGPLHEGEEVIAEEPENGLSAPAMVSRINLTHRYALVRVRWEELADSAHFEE